MARYEINGVKPDGEDRDSCLDEFHIAGYGWQPLEEMLKLIDAGTNFYVTNTRGQQVEVVAKQRPNTLLSWQRYLTTEADGVLTNNLAYLARTA